MSRLVANAYIVNPSSAPELTGLDALRDGIERARNDVFAVAWSLPAASLRDESGYRIELVDDLDEPDDIAYHDVENGRPLMRIGINATRAFCAPPLLDALSVAIGHEWFETSCNPMADLFISVPGHAVSLAKEVVDPVQGETWRHESGVLLPDFVLPAYFDSSATGPFDHLSKLTAPFSCSHIGYQSWSDGSSTFGERVPTWKRRHVLKHGRIATRHRR